MKVLYLVGFIIRILLGIFIVVAEFCLLGLYYLNLCTIHLYVPYIRCSSFVFVTKNASGYGEARKEVLYIF